MLVRKDTRHIFMQAVPKHTESKAKCKDYTFPLKFQCDQNNWLGSKHGASPIG